MTIEIKVSTAVTFLLGPFVDKDDGVAVETGLATAMDNATTGIRVSKNGGNMADRNDATAPVHDEDGFYTVVLDTTDTNALGFLRVEYSEPATALPAWIDFSVVTANYWDTKYGADAFDVNLIADQSAVTIGVVNLLAANAIAVGVIATDAIGVLAMAPNSISADVMASESIASGVLSSAALTQIEDEIWNALKSAHTTPGSFGDFLDIETSSRLASADINLTAGAIDLVTLTTTTTAVTDRVTANTDQWAGGTIPAQSITGVPEVDVTHFVAELAPAPIITGVPDVNAVRILDVAPTLTNNDLDVNIAQIIGTAPTLTTNDLDVNVASMDADTLNASALATDAVNEISRAIGIQKNTAFPDIPFLMVLTSDHVTPATGLTVTGTMRIDNASFVAVNGTITEVANGIYEFDALAADTNGDKITYRFISATADDTFVTIKTVA